MEVFVNFVIDEMEDYVKVWGLGFLVNVGWVERGDGWVDGYGNMVFRFYLIWGIGFEVVRVFVELVKKVVKKGIVEFRYWYCVDEIILDEFIGRVVGVKGSIFEEDNFFWGVKLLRIVVD